MSRLSSMSQPRNLTQTEELERLEQQITLTLQEIDANFSRAHRILTSRILPTIQQYATHSDAVWDGAKFWKQFFEASANVSLSGYEEAPEEGETLETTTEGEGEETVRDAARSGTPSTTGGTGAGQDESLLDSPSVTVAANAAGTTPPSRKTAAKDQARTPKQDTTAFAEYSSPYETLRQEMGLNGGDSSNAAARHDPTTPGRYTDNDTSPTKPSPFMQPSTQKRRAQPTRHQDTNPLLHRILDKTYRVQATPHRSASRPKAGASSSTLPSQQTGSQRPGSSTINPALDSSPFSPGVAAPTFNTQLLGSPARQRQPRPHPTQAGAQSAAPRTPGVSVYKSHAIRTPAGTSARKVPFKDGSAQGAEQTGEVDFTEDDLRVDWDSDDSDLDGRFAIDMSPPKTIRFNLGAGQGPAPGQGDDGATQTQTQTQQTPGASRLMQTPAKEASRRIVDDLLQSAGYGGGSRDATDSMSELRISTRFDAEDEDEFEDDLAEYGRGEMDDSPSVVRVRKDLGADDEF